MNETLLLTFQILQLKNGAGIMEENCQSKEELSLSQSSGWLALKSMVTVKEMMLLSVITIVNGLLIGTVYISLPLLTSSER